jgi:hypothetical protein
MQVYIMLRQWYFPWYTVVSTVFSLLSLAWSITNLKKARKIEKGRDFKLRTSVSFFLYQLLSLSSRLFAIAIFAYVFTWYVFVALGLHWLLAIVGNVLCTCINCDSHSGNIYHPSKAVLKWICYLPFSFFHPSKAMLQWLKLYSHSFYFALYGAIFVENFIFTLTAVFIVKPGIAHLNVVGPIVLGFVIAGLVLSAVLSVVYHYYYEKPTEQPPV